MKPIHSAPPELLQGGAGAQPAYELLWWGTCLDYHLPPTRRLGGAGPWPHTIWLSDRDLKSTLRWEAGVHREGLLQPQHGLRFVLVVH